MGPSSLAQSVRLGRPNDTGVVALVMTVPPTRAATRPPQPRLLKSLLSGLSQGKGPGGREPESTLLAVRAAINVPWLVSIRFGLGLV